MTLKDLVLLLDGSELDDERLKLSVDLAGKHDAALKGLFIGRHVVDGLLLDAPPSGVLIETLERERQARRNEVERRFDRITRNAKPSCRLSLEDGDPVHWLAHHGRYADLVITGQPTQEEDLLGTGGIPGGVALCSGRPVLMIPRAGAESLDADRIIVAWNGSREAARAINDALLFLQRAGRVEVLTIGTCEDAEPDLAGAQDMARHLSRHGVAAEANVLAQPEADKADALLAHVHGYGADLVIMGAYGRSRLREFVLGGMTRKLLGLSPVPLFLSH